MLWFCGSIVKEGQVLQFCHDFCSVVPQYGKYSVCVVSLCNVQFFVLCCGSAVPQLRARFSSSATTLVRWFLSIVSTVYVLCLCVMCSSLFYAVVVSLCNVQFFVLCCGSVVPQLRARFSSSTTTLARWFLGIVSTVYVFCLCNVQFFLCCCGSAVSQLRARFSSSTTTLVRWFLSILSTLYVLCLCVMCSSFCNAVVLRFHS